MPSALAGAQCVPFRVVKMRRRSPRSSFRRNYRVAHSFSLRGARVLRPRAPMLLQDENNVLSCVTYNSSQPCAQHLGRTRQIVFGAKLQNKKPTLLCELFVLETGVDASRSALVLVCAAPPQHNLRLARGRSFTQRENASRSDAPRSAGTIASSLIFPLRFLSVISGWLLKQKHPTDVGCFCFGNRRRHTLPGRVQPSTLCADELNFCVRYENRWDLIAIDTGNC